ncbi:MAG: transporter ATP-binding protein [Paenibacillus sp.]|jgi:ABC-2 type transport system ATP-binding protein|nr:transporter ATP-binding protein [Paenibacillus sp.]
MSVYAVSIEGVEKRYERFQLGPIRLKVEPGVVVAIVGSNGSGKTTLFHMLMNTVRPDRGEIRLFGESYAEREVEMKRRIGFMAESSYAEEAGWRIRDIVSFTSHWYPNWDAGKWEALAERFELDPKAKVNLLSKGMKRRLMFSLCIAQNPELLLLDEPSSGLDPSAWRIMLDEIKKFMTAGDRTVLMATHTMEEVRRLADYVAFVHDGKLLEYKDKDALSYDWKTLWIGEAVGETEALQLPGVVACELGTITRLTTRDASATEQALEHAGIEIVNRQPVELDEMLHQLIVMEKQNYTKELTGR